MVAAKLSRRVPVAKLAALLLWLGVWSMLVATACPPPGVTYVYDENGRLAAVVDSSFGTATYEYDEVGNVKSIARWDVTKVLVRSFSPGCADTGTPVTIRGTGFDTTAVVTFSKTGGGTVTAPVSSATYSELVTSVPSTATSGPVTVTVGSDSDSRTCAVGCGAPTISSFSPPVASPGAVLTINGTNFRQTAADNVVGVSINGASVNSPPILTQIAAMVPNGGSGRVTVTTPFGKAVGPGDFYIPPIPPSGEPASVDLNASPRMSVGQTLTVNFATTNSLGLILFDGTPAGGSGRKSRSPEDRPRS